MLLPRPSDAVHKAWLYRLLSAIADDVFLVTHLRFKGGTYAAMRGILERFSIDLDFDLLDRSKISQIRRNLERIFSKLDLSIKEQSQKVPQYFLRYPSLEGQSNTIKVDITFPPPQKNEYEPVRLTEIDRILYGHTIPTLFSNKLVAPVDRFQKFRSLAGRDIFDIHTFFIKGYRYRPEIIHERTGKTTRSFLKTLRHFMEDKVTQTVMDQDLNVLLPAPLFRKIRKSLKPEVLLFLTDEINRFKT